MRDAVLPSLAVFACVFALNIAGTGLLFSRGFAYMLGPTGLAIGVGLMLGLAAACRVVLTRLKGLPPSTLGLDLDARALGELLVATAAAFGAVTALVAVLVSTGHGSWSWVGGSPWAGAVGLAACLVNAAFQQLGLQSLGLAASRGSFSLGASALTLGLFVGTHAAVSSAPLYLLNVALFGGLTLALFWLGRPSYAAPVGLHGGWNAALVFYGDLPESASLAACPWTPIASAWTGGARGLESGLAYTLALLGVSIFAMLVMLRRQPNSWWGAPAPER